MNLVVDLFAGIRGWSGSDGYEVGIELDADACQTSRNAGMPTLRADVRNLPIRALADMFDERVVGITASPPCQSFSLAGKGEGRAIVAELCGDAYARRYDRDLVLEPLRHVLAWRPTWTAWEQVPPVLPIWEACAAVLEQEGYRTWVGLLRSEQFGVPQTRTRAILMAHRDRPVSPPAPTHQRYEPGVPAQTQHGLFGDLLPWVSMAEALSWGMDERPYFTLATAGGKRGGADEQVGGSNARASLYRERDECRWVVDRRTNSKAAGWQRNPETPMVPSLTGKSGGQWVMRQSTQKKATVRDATQPAATVHFGHRMNDVSWIHGRPATAVCADPRLMRPGHHDSEESGSQMRDAIRLTIEEALILQGFPSSWPLAGSRTSQFRQIGNCIPRPLARAIVRSLTGVS